MVEMMTVEQRVSALESELAALQKRVDDLNASKNWIEEVSGSMKDYPEYDEVLRLGAEWRRSQKDPF
jgi:prefoldin subunit 5